MTFLVQHRISRTRRKMRKRLVKFHFSIVHQFYNVRSLDKRCNIWNALVVSSATFGNEKFLFTHRYSQEVIYRYNRWHDFNYFDLYYKDTPCLNKPYDISNCCSVSKGRLQFLEHFEGICLFKLHRWCRLLTYIVM